jgi:hypothetical protein
MLPTTTHGSDNLGCGIENHGRLTFDPIVKTDL